MTDIDLDPEAPHHPVRTIALGEALSDVARCLNYATRDPAGLQTPAAAERLLGNVAITLERMPQLASQIAGRLSAMHESGNVASAHGAGAADRTARAVAALGLAGAAAGEAARFLQQARNEAAALCWDDGEGDGTQ